MLELLRRRYRRRAPPLLSFSFPLPFLFSSSSFSSAQRPEFLNGYFLPVGSSGGDQAELFCFRWIAFDLLGFRWAAVSLLRENAEP